MTNGKINRKYYVLIWAALIVACFVRNAYGIYLDAISIEEPSRIVITITVVRILFVDGVLPAAIAFVCAFVVWQIGAYRYVRCVPRNDFCYLAMAFTAAVKFVVGILEIFSILEPDISCFTSTVLDTALLTGAMLAMFFFVINKWYKLNPVEKYNAFRIWSTVYMVVAGLSVLGSNGAILLFADAGSMSDEILKLLIEIGYIINDVQVAMSITAICIYFAYLVAVIVLGELMRKQSNKFRNPETRGEFYAQYDNRAYTMRSDAERVFEEYDASTSGGAPSGGTSKKEEEHVFDEFDL